MKSGDHPEAEAVRKHSTVLLSWHPNPEPHLEFHEFAILLEVLERVADKTCLMLRKQASKRRCHGNQKDVEEKILFTVNQLQLSKSF